MSDPPPPHTHRRLLALAAFAVLLASPPAVTLAFLFGAVAFRVAHTIWRHRRAARLDRAQEAEAVALGADRSGRRVLVPDRALEAHGLILGASGAGKSTTLLRLLSAQIRRGAPVIAIDLKGSPSFARHLQAAAADSGRRLRVWTPDGPERWNPLAHGNPTELKDKLIATERFTEPHYQRAAERYVQTVIRTIQCDPSRPVTLQRVVALLDPRKLAAATRRLPAGQAEQVRDYLDSLTPDQLSAVRGLASRLAILTESHSGAYLDAAADALDVRTVLAGGDVALFSLNSSTYGRLAAQLGTLVVQDLVTATGERLRTGAVTTATVGIDEFSALGSDNVIALLARGREAGVSVLLATQELADLDRAGRGLRDQVLGNTAVKIAHRQDVPESAEAVARLAGRERVWERSYAVRAGLFGGPDPSRGTLRLAERYRIEPDRVRTLGTGEAVVIVKTPSATARLARVSPPERYPPAPGVTR